MVTLRDYRGNLPYRIQGVNGGGILTQFSVFVSIQLFFCRYFSRHCLFVASFFSLFFCCIGHSSYACVTRNRRSEWSVFSQELIRGRLKQKQESLSGWAGSDELLLLTWVESFKCKKMYKKPKKSNMYMFSLSIKTNYQNM